MKKVLFAVIASMVMTSCLNEKDYYDPNYAKEAYKSYWKKHFGEIDPNQDWSMATRTNAVVDINADALEQYQVKIYTANPVYDSNAYLLAVQEVQTDENGKAQISADIDIPKGTEVLYASIVGRGERRMISLIEIKEKGKAYNVSNVAMTRADEDDNDGISKKSYPYTVTQLETMLGSAYELGATRPGNFANSVAKVTTSQTSQAYFNEWGANMAKTIIVADGATLSITQGQIQSGIHIIVMDGGKLDLTQAVCGNYSAHIMANSTITIMPGGTLVNNSEKALNLDGGTINNWGTIAIKDINVNGTNPDWGGATSEIYQAGVMTAGTISMVNQYTTLTNWGKLSCNALTGNGSDDYGLGEVNNGCYFHANSICVKSLNQAANTSIECESLSISGQSTLRKNSILRTNNLQMNGGSITYVGPATESALLSAKLVSYLNEITLTGGFWFEADSFAKPEGGDSDWYLKMAENACNAGGLKSTPVKVGEANIFIDGSNANTELKDMECSGTGNTPGGGFDTDDEPYTWRVACEDLGSLDDYDFNDIVLGISHTAGTNTLTITPLAAGGTLQANVLFDGTSLGEIHEMLGADEGYHSIMINTGAGATGTCLAPSVITLADADKNASIMQLLQQVGIEVITTQASSNRPDAEIVTNSTVITAPDRTGTAPQMILLPNDWRWPRERVSIESAYPNFTEWNKDATLDDWNDVAVEDLLYQGR